MQHMWCNGHIKSVHDGKKPFECTIGGANSEDITSVYDGIKPSKCNRGDTSFTWKGDLNRHMASVHNGFIYAGSKVVSKNFKQVLDQYLKIIV